jgi:mRNA interferase MazF
MEQLMMELNKGDIVTVNFNPTKGKEIGKLRPAVILSSKDDNEILDTVIVIPLSTVIEPNTIPYRVHIPLREKLLKNSDACIYEIRALSKTRIKEKLATLDKNEIEVIQKLMSNY